MVFNEFLVLSCFGLDFETHSTVSERAASEIIDKNYNIMDEVTDDSSDI